MKRCWCIIAIFSVSGFLLAYLNDITIRNEIANKRIQPDNDDLEEFHKKRSRLNKYLLQPHGKRKRKRQTLFGSQA